MMPIQIILLVFFLFATGKVIGRYRAHELSTSGLVGWSLFWIIAAVIVVLPDTTFALARLVGVTRGADVVVYVALALIFFIVFRLMVRQEKTKRDLTALVRKLALDKETKL